MTAPAELTVVRTGLANLASVLAGLRRAGATPLVTREPADVEAAAAVVVPGVGSFAPAVEHLRETGMIEVLRARIERDAPTLAICLGMQLLLDGSDESPGTPGLGVVTGRAERFGPGVRVPQLGWNHIVPDGECELLRPGDVYFANSYRLVAPPPGFSSAYADHGGRFVAAIERGPVLACQFHPELSGKSGLALLRRWLVRAEVAPC